eukprot:scaffold97124_cov57-Phaeocystis_antarctica.AAC.2
MRQTARPRPWRGVMTPLSARPALPVAPARWQPHRPASLTTRPPRSGRAYGRRHRWHAPG